mmetsp:Transcript_66892/g.145374  ORF Transcript_66892/g.145374 Transcript_66892/m.145374 type:complete len:415 (+) Transcript_66892:41-1285(+)
MSPRQNQLRRSWPLCLLPVGCIFASFWLDQVLQASFLLNALSGFPPGEVDHGPADTEASPVAPMTSSLEHESGPSDTVRTTQPALTQTVGEASTEVVHAGLGRSILEPLDYVNNKWFKMIHDIQSDCALATTTHDLMEKGLVGFGGEMLQLGLAMRKALIGGRRVRFKGHIGGSYSKIEYCRKVLGEKQYRTCSFTCFFEPISICPDDPSDVQGNISQAAEEDVAYLKTIQNQTNSFEMATDLYHALTAHIYRMNPRTSAMIHERSRKVGFDETALHPLVALHIRRGDKIIDKYNRYHTIREYVRPLYSYAAKAAVCNSGSELVTMQVYVASDSLIAFPEVDRHLKHTQAGNCRFQVIGESGSLSQQKGSEHKGKKHGEMATMMLHLNAEDGLEATLEIIFDIYMLSVWADSIL